MEAFRWDTFRRQTVPVLVRAVAWTAVLSGIAAVAFTGYIWLVPLSDRMSSLSSSDDSASVLGWGVLGVIWSLTGAVLISARPLNKLGWLLLIIGVSQAWHIGLIAYAVNGVSAEAGPWSGALVAGYVGKSLFVLGVLATPTLLLALYPEGRLPSKWWRWPVGAAALAAVNIAALNLFVVFGDPRTGQGVVIVPDFLQGIPSRLMPPTARLVQPMLTTDRPLPQWVDVFQQPWLQLLRPLWVPLFVLATLVIWVGTVVRLFRTEHPHRQQLAWLVCLIMPSLAASWVVPSAGRALALSTLTLVPVAVAVGVLRYRLLGIETVLRRGLVYGSLTAAVFGAYLAASALAGNVVDRGTSAGVFAAALVAVVLAPARDRLQRAADRLVYGERRDPLRAMHQLGERVAVTGEVELLAAALSSVADAVRAPGAAVIAPGGRLLGKIGTESANRTVLPLAFGGQPIGDLVVFGPPGGERYSYSGLRLLGALAPQIAVIVRALDLTEALEAERDRVLGATMTERDRLRRDLHDGLGPSLSGVALGLQALGDQLQDAEPGTVTLVERIRDEVGTAVVEVRRIIDDLRPAALDTVPLPEAVRRYAKALSTVVTVEVDAPRLGAVPAAVENAVYRITTEALSNAARHAQAGHVRVALARQDDELQITVADDGKGVGQAVAGVGLTSMRRRAESLGGQLDIASAPAGTTVTAILPLEESE
jgi:signal transduction histidine kinase